MPRYFIEVSYKGTNYGGFQIQQNSNTIQAEIEKTLKAFFRSSISLTGSSRTDAGVHALQNFFHFDSDTLPGAPALEKAVYNLNAMLPPAIVIKSICRVADEMHCRFDAREREYRYFVYQQKDPFNDFRAYYYPYKLDINLLQQAAAIILKYDDFSAFCKRNTQVKTFICNITASHWKQEGTNFTYTVKANRFLRGMVRGLVGTMLKVGTGKLSLQQFAAIIESRSAVKTDFAVPPHGLFLMEVNYQGKNDEVRLENNSTKRAETNDFDETIITDHPVSTGWQASYKKNLLDAIAQTGMLLPGNKEWYMLLPESLAIIGQSFGVSGVYFFEVQHNVNQQQQEVVASHKWVKPEFALQVDNNTFKNIRLKDNPEFRQLLQVNQIVTITGSSVIEGFLTPLAGGLKSLSVMAMPLLINDELFGIIVLDDYTYNRHWTEEEKATLRIIANNLIANYQTNLTCTNSKKINELFGYVMQATNDLIWDWDIVNNVIERSENGFKKLTGFEYQEVKQTIDFWPARVHPDDKEVMLLNFNAALNNPDVFFWENNFRFLKKDGSYSYLADRCYIIRNAEGKATRAIGAAQDITERQKAILELANSELRFRSMIYNISDIITLVNAAGSIIYQSASATRILGFDDTEIFGESFFRLLHPHDAERVKEFFKVSVWEEGNSPLIQFRYRTSKGTYLSLEAVGNNQLHNPAINAIIVVSRDVTDRIKAEDAIRASEEKFRSLVHNISDIISIVSPAGKILYQSSSVKQRMGYNENELSNRNIAEIIHPDDFNAVKQAFTQLIQTGGTSNSAEFRIMNKDGGYFYIEAQATNQINNPTIQGIVITSRDISQRKKIEEERKLLIEELTKNNADLTQFSYIVSHDLRAPLTNLIGMIKLLDLGTIKNSRSLKLLEGFSTSTFKLRDTLNDLTDVLLIKNNTNVEIKTLSFTEVFDAVEQSVSSLIEKSGIIINANFTEAPLVKYSKAYLESIFQNLLTNAIRYASPYRQPQINIVTKKQGNFILMTFADNGVGFNMNMVKGKIFGLHQRFHHHPESRGIGLYLIHSQITSLGGSIAVDSKEDIGTTFFITLKN